MSGTACNTLPNTTYFELAFPALNGHKIEAGSFLYHDEYDKILKKIQKKLYKVKLWCLDENGDLKYDIDKVTGEEIPCNKTDVCDCEKDWAWCENEMFMLSQELKDLWAEHPEWDEEFKVHQKI